MWIVRNQLLHLRVRAADVLWLAGKRDPAERPYPFAEQGPDVSRHKAEEIEGVRDAFLTGDLTDVVAIIECRCAALLHFQYRADMRGNRSARGFGHANGIGRPQLARLF